ncbi:MAG: hypothetical protein NZM12_10965, partial [Steroidobacteraceae bacterium]|nr:hypothetical protein [Steroidobacteraceae bacterium]MDW8260456.1 TonB-dependent receptor [Gammaproteobacteria bacterium]
MRSTILQGYLALAAGGLSFATGAYAQNATVSQDDELLEVVVTAQNRAEDVRDVPIAIDVVTGEELQSAGFGSMNDIDQIAPVVQLNQDQGVVKITVRGVGTNSNDEAQDTSVVVNID